MKDLREYFEDHGYTEVQSVLNSGNVVFSADSAIGDDTADMIQNGVDSQLGVYAQVMIVSAGSLDSVVKENPFIKIADNFSRMLVAFPKNPSDLAKLGPILKVDYEPEMMSAGTHAAYFWCPEGVLACRALKAAGDVLGEDVTTRNWATVLKLHKLVVVN